ncbi:hypothetical protein FACS1894139_11020 [Planctomycetales bacterium]|nr:hypothetical protein FACS1894139_11020 [Planctomycetales bacterium]
MRPLSLTNFIKEFSAFDDREAANWTYIVDGDAPYPATINVLSEKTDSVLNKFAARVTRLMAGEMSIVAGAMDTISLPSIVARILLHKSIEGETLLQVTAQIQRAERVGALGKITAKVKSLYRTFRAVDRIFAEQAAERNPTAWNQWYAEFDEGVTLRGLNCRGVDLSNFDLCAANLIDCNLTNANLSHANLSGADLSRCRLDGVSVDGTDLFGAKMHRRYEPLIDASGLLERESVSWV